MYDGQKIKWHREIFQNFYDGATRYSDYLIDNRGDKFKMGLLNSRKKKLIEATKSKPELAEKIESSKLNDENILEILQKYDQ